MGSGHLPPHKGAVVRITEVVLPFPHRPRVTLWGINHGRGEQPMGEGTRSELSAFLEGHSGPILVEGERPGPGIVPPQFLDRAIPMESASARDAIFAQAIYPAYSHPGETLAQYKERFQRTFVEKNRDAFLEEAHHPTEIILSQIPRGVVKAETRATVKDMSGRFDAQRVREGVGLAMGLRSFIHAARIIGEASKADNVAAIFGGKHGGQVEYHLQHPATCYRYGQYALARLKKMPKEFAPVRRQVSQSLRTLRKTGLFSTTAKAA